MRIALVVLAVISITIMVTASAFNAIATSETEPQRNDLSHGSVAKIHNGIVHVAMPKGKKAFPVELVPVP